MTSAVLFSYAAVLAGPLAWLLRRAGWPSRAPVLGVVTWQLLVGSVLGALLLGALAAIPHAGGDHREHDHVAVAEACLAAVVFLAVAALCLGRAFLAHVRIVRTQRSRHRLLLGIAGRRDERFEAVVVDDARVAAYCVPGPDGQVVLTTAAVTALGDPGLAAVLAHERAHLRGRHHLVIAAVRILRSAFPFVPAFRWANDEVRRLVELLADDVAARHCGRLVLADALITLAADGPAFAAPPVALGAGGPAAIARVERLRRPARPLGRLTALAWSMALGVLLAIPVLVARPAFAGAADILSHCPFG